MGGVTVFGDTSFLGRRVVGYLRDAGETVGIASRHDAAKGDGVERIVADVHDGRSVEAAVAGAAGVVDTLSLYIEHGNETFRSVHVEAAARGRERGAPGRGEAVGARVWNWRRPNLGLSLYSQPRRKQSCCRRRIPWRSPRPFGLLLLTGCRLPEILDLRWNSPQGGRAGCVRGFATVKGRSRESRSMVVGS
jgi:hypothetical protein